MPLEENISWFVFVEGQRHGPVPSERLVTFLESHTAPHDESIRRRQSMSGAKASPLAARI